MKGKEIADSWNRKETFYTQVDTGGAITKGSRCHTGAEREDRSP